MTEVILQVQGAEPRCFLVDVRRAEREQAGWIFSVWALSAFDALQQARLALPREERLDERTRNGEIVRVGLCVGYSDPNASGSYLYAQACNREFCSRKYQRIGVIK